jgi:hypothetical protein
MLWVDPFSATLNEIYDVKSWNETLAGMIKIQDYAYAFSIADPDGSRAIKWHAGTTYYYRGPNPVLMPIKSNGKQVYAMYYPTAGGVIPYKLYEVDNDQDRKRIPVPVPYLVPARAKQYNNVMQATSSQTAGALIYATSYASLNATYAAQGAVIGLTVGIGAFAAVAVFNARYTN